MVRLRCLLNTETVLTVNFFFSKKSMGGWCGGDIPHQSPRPRPSLLTRRTSDRRHFRCFLLFRLWLRFYRHLALAQTPETPVDI